jgi:hypothetical protein
MPQFLGIPLVRLRFRGRITSLLSICEVFHRNPGVGLHPIQIAKATGLSLAVAMARLDETPELFIKLPKRDGLTRYRMATSMAGRPPEEVEAFIRRAARSETLTIYAVGAIALAVLAMIVVMSFPFAEFGT